MRQFSLARFASKKNVEGVDSKVLQIEMRQDGMKGCEREHEKGTSSHQAIQIQIQLVENLGL